MVGVRVLRSHGARARMSTRRRIHGKRRACLPWVSPVAGLLFWLLLTGAARAAPDFAEWYAVRVYPVFVRSVGGFWGLFPFSIGELIVYALAALCMGFLVLLAARVVRHRSIRRMLAGGALGALWILSSILVLFTLFCGINYYRRPFSQLSGLTARPSSAAELAALCGELIGDANATALLLPPLENGATPLGVTPLEASALGRSYMADLAKEYPALEGYYPRAKPVLFARGMSYLELLGVYFPLTIEANFNADTPAYSIPSTICHEQSHLRGFMREDEANFIAYLACRGSNDALFQYSGSMLALVHAMNALYSADYTAFLELYDTYDMRILADFSANHMYWKQFEGPIAMVSNSVNDAYLKVNAQTDGVKSYGRMVDLLLADYRARYDLP